MDLSAESWLIYDTNEEQQVPSSETRKHASPLMLASCSRGSALHPSFMEEYVYFDNTLPAEEQQREGHFGTQYEVNGQVLSDDEMYRLIADALQRDADAVQEAARPGDQDQNGHPNAFNQASDQLAVAYHGAEVETRNQVPAILIDDDQNEAHEPSVNGENMVNWPDLLDASDDVLGLAGQEEAIGPLPNWNEIFPPTNGLDTSADNAPCGPNLAWNDIFGGWIDDTGNNLVADANLGPADRNSQPWQPLAFGNAQNDDLLVDEQAWSQFPNLEHNPSNDFPWLAQGVYMAGGEEVTTSGQAVIETAKPLQSGDDDMTDEYAQGVQHANTQSALQIIEYQPEDVMSASNVQARRQIDAIRMKKSYTLQFRYERTVPTATNKKRKAGSEPTKPTKKRRTDAVPVDSTPSMDELDSETQVELNAPLQFVAESGKDDRRTYNQLKDAPPKEVADPGVNLTVEEVLLFLPNLLFSESGATFVLADPKQWGPIEMRKYIEQHRNMPTKVDIRSTLNYRILKTLKASTGNPKETIKTWRQSHLPHISMPALGWHVNGANPLLATLGAGIKLWPQNQEAGVLTTLVQHATAANSDTLRLADCRMLAQSMGLPT